jgi:hypothetical protein
MPAHTEVDRPLSPVERWYWIADHFSPLNVIARVRVRGPVSVPALRQALDALRCRHPLLRTTIAVDDVGRNPAFVTGRARPLLLREARDGPWEREVDDRELVDRIDLRRGPLCRAVVVTVAPGVHDLLLTASHVIADATTVLFLLREWLELAAGHMVDDRPALPAPEDIFPARHRALRGALGMAARLLPDQRKLRRAGVRRLVPTEPVVDECRRTRLVHRSLAPDALGALLLACKRNECTVHGALAAALTTAVAHDAAVPGPCEYVLGSPIDFRAELVERVSNRDAGSYIATVPSFVPYVPNGEFWSTARAVSRDVAARRRRGDHFAVVNLLRWACPPGPAESESFRRLVEAKGPGNLCLSNIGVHAFPGQIGPWRVSDAQFVTGVSISGYLAATVNTSHDHLFWNFSYVERALSRDRAERIADDSVTVLLSAT